MDSDPQAEIATQTTDEDAERREGRMDASPVIGDHPPSVIESMKGFARRTPNRTFKLYPAIVVAWRLIASRGRPAFDWRFAPLLAWGYLQYHWCGQYRRELGGGGPGLDAPPIALVTTGPYATVRNPMYLGHIIFLIGLALVTRSRLAWLIALGTACWFNWRVEGDETRLRERFGDAYAAYQERTGRWVPRLTGSTT
jgi:hypothetical protein